ncbi:MAG: hypothetical protein Roseis3KO_01730 [Roseivirga sp.]
MTEFFDIASRTYDQDFTETYTGRLQRDQVWKYLDQHTAQAGSLHVLELNCGTGEDAVHLAKSGHVITATDISEEMLERAREKATEQGISHKIHLDRLDITQIDSTHINHKFDLVFSNFGGLNCIGRAELEKFKADIRQLLKPNGTLIMVIMPELCIWESFYFLAKFRLNQVFRRKKTSVMADVSGVAVETWYYSPKKLSKVFKPEFSKVRLKPIGFFAPPSYMETFVKRHPLFFRFIGFMEQHFSRFGWQSHMADHYYIELQAR